MQLPHIENEAMNIDSNYVKYFMENNVYKVVENFDKKSIHCVFLFTCDIWDKIL